jgi:hypothetical protein
MCMCARPYGRAGRCGYGGRGVTNGIRANPRGCVYGSVCGHRANGACGPKMGGGVNVTPDPIWMAHEWPMSVGVRV